MKLFLGFARQAFHESAMYRLEFWMQVLANFALMYGAFWLWNTLYASRPEGFGVSLQQMLTYAMLAMALNTVFGPLSWVRYYITEQVRTGAIQMDLLRPLDFQYHLLARSAGLMLFSLATFGVVTFLSGVLFLGLGPPADLRSGLLFLLSLVLAFLVDFAQNFLIGMISIYSIGARRINWVYQAVMRFFSGQMVPLWIFPPLLGQIALLLPFQALVGIPLSIYIGRLPIEAVWSALALQLFWAVALLALGRLVWRHAHSRLIVQGG